MPLASKIVGVVTDWDAFCIFQVFSEMFSFLNSFFLCCKSRAVWVDQIRCSTISTTRSLLDTAYILLLFSQSF